MTLSEYIQSLQPGDRLKGVLCECDHCGVRFIGTARSLYCSTNCRVKAHRQKQA